MLELGRIARREALDFDHFWERAVRPGLPPITPRCSPNAIPPGAVIWPSDTADRSDAVKATEECKETWRRAYCFEPPTAGDLALANLHAVLVEQDTGGIEAGNDVPLAATI